MADDNDADNETPPPAAGMSKLMLALLVTNLVVLVGAAVGAFFMFGSSTSSAHAEEPEAPEINEVGTLVELPDMVVNLDDPAGSHYARAAFRLELADPDAESDVEAHLIPIHSAYFLYLSGLAVEDTTGREAREAMLLRLTEIANEQIGGELVERVYFTSFVVQ